MTGGWAGERWGNDGYSWVELLLVMALTLALATFVVPLTAHTADGLRTRHAAGYLAARIRLVRQQAVAERRATAVVFDQVDGVWTLRVCADGNGNGVRRADIAADRDRCRDAPQALEHLFAGTTMAVDASLRGPEGEPGSADAVRFGASDMVSCTPFGSCTAGSVFVRSAAGAQYMVRVGNMTGRTRVLRYEPGAARWSEQ